MVNLTLGGVPIEFPFQPYDVQEKFMESVVECLQKGMNGLLESPTGTGKTLCLLCSSLGWLATRKAQIQASSIASNDVGLDLKNSLNAAAGIGWGDGPSSGTGSPKIIYASRTHSQLSQVIAELKRSSYRYMKVCILGSRDQLCIHPEVSKEQNNAVKLHMCHARTSTRTCYFYTNLDAKKEEPDFKAEVLDIEDLVTLGKKHTACPYFMTKEIRKNADIIFMPYNYLLDPKVRKIHQIELQGNIIIFDEAHNVEKMCEDSSSIELKSLDIALCVDEITQVMKKFRENSEENTFDFSSNSAPKDFSLDDLCIIKAMFLELEKAVDAIPITKQDGETLPGEFMLELLGKADLSPTKKDVILELLDKVIQYLTVTSASPYQRKGNGLQKFADLVKIVYSKTNFTAEHMERVKRSYKVHVKIEQPKPRSKGDTWTSGPSTKVGAKQSRVISYWCFSPGFGMRDLVEEGARCVILTSGTLSPLNSFAAELQVPFPITLENPHIIGTNQVLVGVVTHGPDGTILDSSYKNRGNEQYIQSLGRTIRSVAQVVPDGLLVFFPSYPVMKACQEAWQLSGLWDAIFQVKPVFVEPNSKEGFNEVMNGYYSAISTSDRKGACFMAVCRGKVSEGLDFCDGNGRAVIITGLPFPPSRDPRVLEKQKYLEDNRKDPKFQGLSGQQWYRLEATRAVNQAIGRVIRHRLDYGAILLCDQRFSSPDLVKQLSSWVRPRVKTFPKFGPLLRDLGMFFRNAEVLFPTTTKASRVEGASSEPSRQMNHEDRGKRTFSTINQYSHALSCDSSRSVSSGSSKIQSASNPLSNHLNLGDYSTSNNPECSRALNMFDSATPAIIDFNECDATAAVPALNDKTCIEPPALKKRKIQIVSNAEKAKMDRRKAQAAESAEPKSYLQPAETAATSFGKDSNQPDGSQNRKKENAAEYLKSVKHSLDATGYATFRAMINNYRSDKNLDSLLGSLKKIFLQNVSTRHLYQGFRQFILKEHTLRFDDVCRRENVYTEEQKPPTLL